MVATLSNRWAIAILLATFIISTGRADAQSNPPDEPLKLVFIHHSCGENWLNDHDGGLGNALSQNNNYVSDTNYGRGPENIGDRTDITDWPEWFLGPDSGPILDALYNENDRNAEYTRSFPDPGGENRIILFKSCFPNSNLEGNPDDPPLRGEGLSVANAKAIYVDLLDYFSSRPDRLFVAITAPPVQDSTWAGNARAFNTWLVNHWLDDYEGNNVAIFDFYNVLTHPDNHHRLDNSSIEYATDHGGDTLYYPSNGDDHPSSAGNQKATEEFVPLLNVYVNRWLPGAPEDIIVPKIEEPTLLAPTQQSTSAMPTAVDSVATGQVDDWIDDFEGEMVQWEPFTDDSGKTRVICSADQSMSHGGSASLHGDFDVAADGWGSCSLVFASPQDWSAEEGISVYLHSEKRGQTITLAVYGGESPDALQHFEWQIVTSEAMVDGWQPIQVGWNDLRPPAWEDASTRFDARKAMGLAILVDGSSGKQVTSLWVDDVRLEGTIQTTAESIPPAPTKEEPADATKAIASEETSDEGAGSGFCPGIMVLGLLALVATHRFWP